MKFRYKLSKYNPIYRAEDGIYLADEWTSFSDIGKGYNGYQFTSKEYESYEAAFIEIAAQFMKENNIVILRVEELEIYDQTNKFTEILAEGKMVFYEEILYIIKLALREKIWCKLILNNKFYIHFGYDFYMYIGSMVDYKKSFVDIRGKRIYIEEFESPYLCNQR